MQELIDRFASLADRAENNKSRAIRAEEKFEAAKKRVAEVVTDVKEAGYPDPKEIGAIKEAKVKAFIQGMDDLEEVLKEQEAILDRVEA